MNYLNKANPNKTIPSIRAKVLALSYCGSVVAGALLENVEHSKQEAKSCR